jgi:hypothetical protein
MPRKLTIDVFKYLGFTGSFGVGAWPLAVEEFDAAGGVLSLGKSLSPRRFVSNRSETCREGRPRVLMPAATST